MDHPAAGTAAQLNLPLRRAPKVLSQNPKLFVAVIQGGEEQPDGSLCGSTFAMH